jgi:hypothetical protein
MVAILHDIVGLQHACMAIYLVDVRIRRWPKAATG